MLSFLKTAAFVLVVLFFFFAIKSATATKYGEDKENESKAGCVFGLFALLVIFGIVMALLPKGCR